MTESEINTEITQADRNSFMKILYKEKHDILWKAFNNIAWHDRQNEESCREMVKEIIDWAERRKNNEQCCH